MKLPSLALARKGVASMTCPTVTFVSWAFADLFGLGPTGNCTYTPDYIVSDLGQRPVSRFDLTKARSTPRVHLAPRGWTRKRQVPGSHQEASS